MTGYKLTFEHFPSTVTEPVPTIRDTTSIFSISCLFSPLIGQLLPNSALIGQYSHVVDRGGGGWELTGILLPDVRMDTMLVVVGHNQASLSRVLFIIKDYTSVVDTRVLLALTLLYIMV